MSPICLNPAFFGSASQVATALNHPTYWDDSDLLEQAVHQLGSAFIAVGVQDASRFIRRLRFGNREETEERKEALVKLAKVIQGSQLWEEIQNTLRTRWASKNPLRLKVVFFLIPHFL